MFVNREKSVSIRLRAVGLAVLVGAIGGKSKIRFEVDFGNGLEYTDNSVIAIDTAVALIP